MIEAYEVREHMEVIGSDGGHVGRVDHVLAGEIELDMLDIGSGLKHHVIPLSWVERVRENKVCLNMTQDAAKSSWREKH